MNKLILIGLLPFLFLLPHNALAWYGGGGGCGDQNCCCSDDTGPICQNQCSPPIGCGGYCAGQSDAAYDIQNSLQYQPYGQCIPCHGPDYWNNFHQGYDSYWSQHQEQNQGSAININGDNNYVSVNQYQTQNPLQQLAHLACGVINCGGVQSQLQPEPYQQP